MSITKILLYSSLTRVVLILALGHFESIYNQQLSLTDIDYKVYSDATLYPSPYDRHTYRYSPIISYMMKLNYTLYEPIGKLLFVLWDALAVLALWAMFKSERICKIYAYNPLFIYLTLRGSCESVSMALMYLFWHLVFPQGNSPPKTPSTQSLSTIAGFAVYGLWVHVRVYPIIFLPAVLMHHYHANKSFSSTFNFTLLMGLVSGGVFLLLGVLFYWMYGYPFLDQTYLYHSYRLDHRHSFSPLFYEIYLNWESVSPARPLIRLLPFLYAFLSLSFRYSKHISPFYLQFLLTYAFVSFNKVITMQYYMWIFGSLILVLPQSSIMKKDLYRKALALGLQYALGIVVWIWLSIRLEHIGQNCLHLMWMMCIGKLFLDLWVLTTFMGTISSYPVFKPIRKSD